MKTVLLYNHGGCENRGCEAIVRSTSALFAEKGCGCVLASSTADYDRSAALENVGRIVPDVISPYSLSRVINSIGFRLGMSRRQEVARKYSPVIREGRRADLCLSIGGDTYCYGRQEHLAVINDCLADRRKPLVLWGCSIDPELLDDQCMSELSRYSLIMARESVTAQALREKGLPVLQSFDPAFLMKEERLPLPDGWREGHTTGINVSPLILRKAKNGEQTLEAFKALIRHILSETDDSVALIPHVTWAHDNDLEALESLKKAFAEEERVILLPGTLRAPQLKGYISRLRLLITARTHASIAAYSTGVPTLVIGYSVKARGIARDLYGSEEGHLIPVQELASAEELIGAYEAMQTRAETERTLLNGKMPEIRSSVEKMAEDVLKLSEAGK